PSRSMRVGPSGEMLEVSNAPSLNLDLTARTDVAGASADPLKASSHLAFAGFKLHGAGFILTAEDAKRLLLDTPYRAVVKPYLNGQDFAQRSRNAFVIDFAAMEEAEVRAFPLALQHVADRVLPERRSNKREQYRTYWWRFGEPALSFAWRSNNYLDLL
ncbi:MAG: hypothetical protein ACRETL_15975, partial [Gammaproteobacteria bacterium]